MKKLLLALAALPTLSYAFPAALQAQEAHKGQEVEFDWPTIVAEAEGQTVYFNAWGGDDGINAYINWVGSRVEALYGVELIHVKLSDTAAAVQTVETEFAAGRKTAGGSIDMIWINGDNFARLKRQGMLGAGNLDQLPSYQLTDYEDKITLRQDFSESVDGLESPWGLAQFTFLYDSSVSDAAPASLADFAAMAAADPGRLAYPAPPSFVGTTFLKQVALELMADPSALYAPAPKNADDLLAPVWDYLDALHPALWRQGQAFPEDHVAMRDLFNRDEIDLLMTFNPGEVTSLVVQGILPETMAAGGFAAGSIGNAHYVTIPGNSSVQAGAMVVADFLMSPQAQARKADPAVWGDPSVLDLEKLSAEDRALFPAAAPALGASVLEPHASWVEVLEDGWRARFAS